MITRAADSSRKPHRTGQYWAKEYFRAESLYYYYGQEDIEMFCMGVNHCHGNRARRLRGWQPRGDIGRNDGWNNRRNNRELRRNNQTNQKSKKRRKNTTCFLLSLIISSCP